MAINRTIDLLPEYFRTIPNQRFLNSTLDRLVSDPKLRQFDGYVGRRIVNGTTLSGGYINEPSEFRSRYQLEPEFVFRAPGQPTKAAGFKDILNSVSARGGLSSNWNRLITNNSYSYTGFLDLDKFTNYYNYVWIPEPRVINGTRVDENPWFRYPVEVSNSNVPSTGIFTVRRGANGLTVDEVAGVNPELYINRGGTYTFQIEPSTGNGARAPKLITQLDSTHHVTNDIEQSQFNSSYGKFNQAVIPADSELQTASAGQTVFTLQGITYTPGTYTMSVSVNGTNQIADTFIETDKKTITFKNGLAADDQVLFTAYSLPKAGLKVEEVSDFNLKYQPFCIEAWIWIDNTRCQYDQVIVGQWEKNDEANSSWALMRTTDPCTLKFAWRDVNGSIQNMTYVSPTPITTNQWHHVAVTRTGPILRMYFSNAGEGQSNLAVSGNIGTIARSDKPLIIGNDLSQIMGFRGHIDDLRITNGYARYTNLYYSTPGPEIGNDGQTVFLLNFDGAVGSTEFVDNVGEKPSFMWLQTHPGIDGVIPTNPNITSRYVRGVQNNGVTTGDIIYTVPDFDNEQERFYRQLRVTGNALYDFVDVATVLNFDQIDGQALNVFNQVPYSDQDSDLNGHRGGIDGITDLEGKTLIFVNNQQTGWNQNVPWEQNPWEINPWDQTSPVPQPLWFGIWQITIINGIIKLNHLASVTANYKIRIKNGVTYRNTSWFKSSVTNVFEAVPPLSGDFTTLFLQDDQNASNVLPVNVINTEVPTLNVDTDIIGKQYYTSGNGVRFVDGMRIRFGSGVEPEQYVTPVLKAKAKLYQSTYTVQDNTINSTSVQLNTVVGLTPGMSISGLTINNRVNVVSVDTATNTLVMDVPQTLFIGDVLYAQVDYEQTIFTLMDASDVQIGDILHITDEQLLVLSVNYLLNQATVSRGFGGTSPTPHSAGSLVQIYSYPSYIIEGVGSAICLVPYEELTTVESYLDLAQEPDYVTINRASADRNPWSRTNRWFNKTVVDLSVQYLQQQGLDVVYPELNRASRPILEFQAGLRLTNFGTKNLTSVQVLDTTVLDALSNINGRRAADTRNITLMQDLSTDPDTLGHLLVDGDLVIFNADLDPAVREKVYKVEYVDVDGDLDLFTTYERVIVASTGNIEQADLTATYPTIDGYGVNDNDRVLIWQQTNAIENGIYKLNPSNHQLELVDPIDYTYSGDFYLYVAGPVGDVGGTTYANTYFRYYAPVSGTYVSGTSTLTFDIVVEHGPVLNLVEYATAQEGSCTTVTSKDSKNRGINYYWNFDTKTWVQSSQTKTKVQQKPLFDVFDYLGNSYGNTDLYPQSTFEGSTLFEYQENEASAVDPVLGLRLTYRNITNVGDITFANTYGTDEFDYVVDSITGATETIKINNGVVKAIDPLTLKSSDTTGWSETLTNLELYQNLQYTGVRTVDIKTTLLNKTTANNTQIWVDEQQISPSNFTVRQLGDIVRVTISDAITVNSDSSVLIKLIAAKAIEGAWYDSPPAYGINPYNQIPKTFAHDDIKQHTDAIHSQHGHAVSSEDSENSLNDIDHTNKPGLIQLQEGFGVLPTLMLTDSRFDIDRALKTAADDYELFKQKFLQTMEQIENIVNMSPRDAVDAVFAALNVNASASTKWYTSDMVPVLGSATTYVVDDPQRRFYETTQQIDQVACNKAALVYLNGKQLVRGIDYELFTGRAAIEVLITLHLDDLLVIYESSNTDGCCVPSTPAKLGLGPVYIPSMFTDNTYQNPTLVIQGHDGSITRAYNDYRDAFLMELEYRIYNNIKVDSEFWSQVILDRVPEAGRFRELNGLTTYNMIEQAAIERKFFYEWVAEHRVNFRNTVYELNNTFTYNYSGCTDRINGEFLLGYWRGAYRDFYDTDRPHTNPWEMLGLTVKPSWWDTTYGPAPYTGENLILWDDIQKGIIRQTGEYSVSGPRTTELDNSSRTAKLSVLDVIPVTPSGELFSPNESLVADLNTGSIRNGFTFNDGGPVETAWRRSSTYPFAKLRLKILENPHFMLGTLWDLDSYKPQVRNNVQEIASKFTSFKFNQSQYPSIENVLIHNLDTDSSGNTVRRHSVLNYIVEYLTGRGETADLFKYYIQTSTVNLVYNLAGFADKNNLNLYAEQNSPQTIQQSVKIPNEDYTLLLSQSMPVGQVVYSGVIITRSDLGYRVSGYDKDYPFFIINPGNVTGKTTTISVGSQSFVINQEFEDQPIYVPYNFEFTSRQTVVDFLNCYGEYLRRQGFIFDTDRENERINWTDAAIQFLKWSYYNWSGNNGVNRISLVLNPGSGLLKFAPVAGALDNLMSDQSLLLDENQNRIDVRFLDVFRDSDITYVNNQQELGVISALRANVVNFEHKVVINNQTVFNDLIYNPVLGTRQNRIRMVGLKTADWNGTLLSNGFLMMLSDVEDWQPNTDYLRGSIVRYKNQNWVALNKIIGDTKFQSSNFSIMDTNFQDQLMPSIGAKALDLEHGYDPYYHNSIPDMVRLRCDALGYVERTWLANLGLDLLNQTEFYRGWIKQKGTLDSVNKFTSAGTTDLLADFTVSEEYAVKLGEYGSTGRTGFVEVELKGSVASNNPVAVEFISGNSTVTSSVIQVNNSELYKKSQMWDRNFVQTLDNGNLVDEETAFLNAGPVLPKEIYDYAQSNTLEYNAELEKQLTFNSKLEMTQSTDVGNLIKNIRNGNWIWAAVNDTDLGDDRYDVMSWSNSNAKVLRVFKDAKNSAIDLYLSADIDAKISDIVAIDHTDKTAKIQGVFLINDYRVAPTDQYHSILSIKVKDINKFTFSQNVYAADVAEKSVYVYHTMRHNDIGSANLTAKVNRLGQPTITKAYVDYDSTGYAVYDFREPFITGITDITVASNPLVGSCKSVAQDSDQNRLWLGFPAADSGNGLVTISSISGSGSSVQLANLTGISVISGQGTLGLGTQIVTCGANCAVASATDINNRGQVYAIEYSNAYTGVREILKGEDVNDAYFGTSISASADGNWLAVGATYPGGTGKVFVYHNFHESYPAPVWTLTHTIDDPDSSTGGLFGSSVSLNADGSVLAVGAPSNGVGRVYIFNRDIQRYIKASTNTTITLASVVGTSDLVDLRINGILRASGTDYTATSAGDTTITMATAVPAGSLIEIDLLNYSLVHTQEGTSTDVQYGASVSANGNFVAVGSPHSVQTLGSLTLQKRGRVELLGLISEVNQTLTIDTTSGFTPDSNNSLRINNWIVTAANVNAYVTAINTLTQYTGVTATLNGTELTLSFQAKKHVSGVVNVSTTTLNIPAATTAYQVVGGVGNPVQASTGFAQKLRWITNKMLVVVENYTDFDHDTQLTFVESNTKFDSGSTVFYNGEQNQGQRAVVLQFLRTSRDYTSQNSDTVQLVRSHVIPDETGTVDLIFDGDIEKLWIGNSLSSDPVNIKCYSNDNLVSGWTVNRQQQEQLDAHSIFRAWIYNATRKEKLVDLDVVDIQQGLLPGAVAQYIDYVSSTDPAVYGVPNWRSGITYEAGFRVMYNDTVYVARQQNNAIFFNEEFWKVDQTQSKVSNTGSIRWGASQIGQTWFCVSKLRSLDYQQGSLGDRVDNYNDWFPATTVKIYEWVSSNQPPTLYAGTGSADVNTAYVFDSTKNLYYFWVLNKTEVGPIHPVSASAVSTTVRYLNQSGLPMISPATSNSVILYNVKNLVDSGDNVLHIDYVLSDHNNRLHSEYVLLSEDGTNKWLNTPLYTKMIDSLAGKDENGLAVPDPTLIQEDRYGVNFRPRQTMFRDRNAALDIYFNSINDQIVQYPIALIKNLDLLKLTDVYTNHVDVTYSFTVPDRDTLLVLDVTEYAEDTQVLVISDILVANAGWNLVKLQSGKWVSIKTQQYDLGSFWSYQDWKSETYVSNHSPDYEIPHIGYLESIEPDTGDYIKIISNGNEDYAVYEKQSNGTLEPVYIQNGTILFNSSIANANESDSQRMIVTALNEHILTDTLSVVVNKAFFAVLRFVLQESRNVDWLFRTSFINIIHRVKNLNRKTNFRQDDEQFIKDFMTDTKPFHTRIRDYVNVYTGTDTAGVVVSDFDIPALYDKVWYQSQFVGSTGKLYKGQAKYFDQRTALAEQSQKLYVGTTGLATHPMGLFGADQLYVEPAAQDWVFALNISPTDSATKYAVPVNGAIGIATNGVPFYSVVASEKDKLLSLSNPGTEETYTVNIGANNTNYIGPDLSNGFIVNGDAYVYRMNPALLYESSSSEHSPLLGFALDGYPIYGPYGYRRSDGSGGIIMNTSSYRLRTDLRLGRIGIDNGSAYATYVSPTGEYIEDWEYLPDFGTLDEHNGRFVITPEYPYGTYAYFVTIDPNSGAPAYPYIIGPTFNGVPTGLRYDYVGENVVPIYTNGDYTMPQEQKIANTIWPLHSPTGLDYNDDVRLTQGVYANWNSHHTYELSEIVVADPGINYTQTPNVEIYDQNGTLLGTARVSVNTTTKQLNPTVTIVPLSGTKITGLTQTPRVVVTGGLSYLSWDSGTTYAVDDTVFYDVDGKYYQALLVSTNEPPSTDGVVNSVYWAEIVVHPAILVPVLANATIRKINTTMRFDRVKGVVNIWNNINEYEELEVVFYEDKFYQALQSVPVSTAITNTDYWHLMTDVEIAETDAANRITALYNPTSSMISNDLTQLLVGADYAGVRVQGLDFADKYTVPQGSLADQEDNLQDRVVLNLQATGLLDNSYSYKHRIAGQRSADFAPAGQYVSIQYGEGDGSVRYEDPNLAVLDPAARYFVVDPAGAGVSNLALGYTDFTIEFWFMTRSSNTQQVMFDSTSGVGSGDGILVQITTDNTINVRGLSYNDELNITGGLVTQDVWQHVAIERKLVGSNDQFNLYLDGYLVGSQTVADNQNYSSSNLTLGARIDNEYNADIYMDELRISNSLLRYDVPTVGETYEIPVNGFGRTSATDSYISHVVLLYGFESLSDDLGLGVDFIPYGVVKTMPDLSVNKKMVIAVNPDLISTSTEWTTGATNISEISVATFGTETTNYGYLHAGVYPDYNLGTGEFTIEFWSKPDSMIADKTVFTLGTDYNSTNHSLKLTVTTGASSHTYTLTVSTQVGVVKTLSYVISGTGWADPHFVSIERYRQTLQMFIDGQLVAFDTDATYSFGLPEVPIDLIIGNDTLGYLGDLADFRITNGVARHAQPANIDTVMKSDFADYYLGIRSEDINVTGSGFVNNINSPATEEHVNGRLYDTLDIRVFSNADIDPTLTGFRMFKDMLDNWSFYAIPATGTTTLDDNLLSTSDEIYLTDASGFTIADPTLGRGVLFVGGERIVYRNVDLVRNRLTGLIRGTQGTHVPKYHATGVRVENAGIEQTFPGTAGIVAVVHTVQTAVVSNTDVVLDSVKGIQTGMSVTGANITGTPTVISIDTTTNTVTLSSTQTLSALELLTFGTMVLAVTQPFTWITANSQEAYSNTWNTLGVGEPSDGLGLQNSTTTIATFLLNNPALLP